MATPAVYAIPAEEGFSARAVRALVLALSGLAAAVGTGWIVGQSAIVDDPTATALLRSLLVACYAAVGAYTWWRRPGTRLGPVVAGLGFVYALASLSAIDEPVPFAIGRLA